MGANFETLHRGSAVIYGTSGGIWVMTLFAKPTAVDMHLARRALKTMHERHPNGFPTLTWVLAQAGFSMDSDARHAAAEVTKAYSAAIVAQATLIEGQGFQLAAVRAIVAGLDLMSRSSAPKKVFADLPSCIDWCASRRPRSDADAGAPDQMVASVRAMRQTL